MYSVRDTQSCLIIDKWCIVAYLYIHIFTTSQICTRRFGRKCIVRDIVYIADHILSIYDNLDSSRTSKRRMIDEREIIIRVISSALYSREIKVSTRENIWSVIATRKGYDNRSRIDTSSIISYSQKNRSIGSYQRISRCRRSRAGDKPRLYRSIKGSSKGYRTIIVSIVYASSNSYRLFNTKIKELRWWNM